MDCLSQMHIEKAEREQAHCKTPCLSIEETTEGDYVVLDHTTQQEIDHGKDKSELRKRYNL